MFPKLDSANKGNQDFVAPSDQKKDNQKGNKLELTSNEFMPSDGQAPIPAGVQSTQFYKQMGTNSQTFVPSGQVAAPGNVAVGKG